MLLVTAKKVRRSYQLGSMISRDRNSSLKTRLSYRNLWKVDSHNCRKVKRAAGPWEHLDWGLELCRQTLSPSLICHSTLHSLKGIPLKRHATQPLSGARPHISHLLFQCRANVSYWFQLESSGKLFWLVCFGSDGHSWTNRQRPATTGQTRFENSGSVPPLYQCLEVYVMVLNGRNQPQESRPGRREQLCDLGSFPENGYNCILLDKQFNCRG